jgi:hypothetical protein
LGDLGFVQWVSLGFLFAAPERVALKRPPSPKVTSPSTTLTSEPQISKSILPSKPVPALSPPYRKSYDIFQQALAESPLKSIHTPSAYSSTGKSGFPLSTNVAQNSVEIAWPAQASGDAAVQGYNVYVSIVPGADFRKLNEAPIVATRWSGEMGLHGMTYYFLVKAIGPQGTETQSSEIKSVDLP